VITRVAAVVCGAGVLAAVQTALGRARGVHLCGASGDLAEAGALIKDRRPDVLVLGLAAGGDAALDFLDRLMRRFPLPVVALAPADGPGGRLALRALDLGALEVLDSLALRRDEAGRSGLVSAVRAAHRARETDAFRDRAKAARRRHVNALRDAHRTVVAIGASTGGTEALHRILTPLPVVTPGILIVQHMPAGFTRAFAASLSRTCQMEVREAATGDRVRSGLILIAPGDRHLRVRREGGELVVALGSDPEINRHRPSVDALFDSVVESCGGDAVGVILTGMGADGAAGLRRLRDAGAATIAQNEASCVVYGMPREAVDRGAAERVLPLDKIPPALLLAVLRKSEARRPVLQPL